MPRKPYRPRRDPDETPAAVAQRHEERLAAGRKAEARRQRKLAQKSKAKKTNR